MKQQNIKIAQFVGLLGCLLVITSCCLFRSPKDPNQIQNPPPTDRYYLACRVNGKPVVFKEAEPLFAISSEFSVLSDSTRTGTIVKFYVRGVNKTAFKRVVELRLRQEFTVFDDVTKKTSTLFKESVLQNAYYFFGKESHLSKSLIRGTMQITDFEYDKISSSRPKGNLSGVFEFTCLVLDPETNEIDTCKITDGVFNVIMI